MITTQLINPKSIVVIGASNNIAKPGAKIYFNIKKGTFKGDLYAVNPNEKVIQGDACFQNLADLPVVELAVLAIPAKFCSETVEFLAAKKKSRAFIIISAGFSEENEEGEEIERKIVSICNHYGASLIGPNCIGVMTQSFQGVFTLPIPKLDQSGCDFISGSGATAVFIMEAGLQKGLKFNSVFSVGNSAQNGVEDVLEFMDDTYINGTSSRVKILYFESIKNPAKLLKHASSLINKGCRIAAIKAGTSEAGSRAASSHTGAMSSSDVAVDALFRKAGIIRCFGREELTTVAAVLLYPELPGENFAIITHAGGPAVMLTDVLSEGKITVPHLKGEKVDELLSRLYSGSSAANPIDILATGTAEHVKICLNYCENIFSEIDSIIIIYGTPGLSPVYDVYDELHKHILYSKKAVYPVLPSITTAADEVSKFLSYGHMNFPDEVILGKALVKVKTADRPVKIGTYRENIEIRKIRKIIDKAENGYLSPGAVSGLLAAGDIPMIKEFETGDLDVLKNKAEEFSYPLVMKVVGPIHKSDVGGVEMNIGNTEDLINAFQRMQRIDGYSSVLIQPRLQGRELFIGASYKAGYGHLLMCGLGGIFVEVLKDISIGLAPLTFIEAMGMIERLRSYKLLTGIRGQQVVNIKKFAEIIVRLSVLLNYCKEIVELDLNPLIAVESELFVVDARIRIEK